MRGGSYDDYPRQSIHIGGVWASRQGTVVRTVLGSCISVCLRDPITRVGGMNHFMLPSSTGSELSSTRYGVNAMELLINKCMREGADRTRLEAKVFGGGHVLRTANHSQSVPRKNIEFAFEFLKTEGFPIRVKDVGGHAAREVLFFTDTGRVLLKRLTPTGSDVSQIADQELHHLQTKPAEPKESADITLF